MLNAKKILEKLEYHESLILGMARETELLIEQIKKYDTPINKLIAGDLITKIHGLQCAHSALEWAAQRLGAIKEVPVLPTPETRLEFDGVLLQEKVCAEIDGDNA